MVNIFELYLSAVRDVHTIRCSSLAASMIVFYDHFITLDREIKHIWTAPWSSIGKSLFLINRYYTLLVAIFNNYVIFAPHLSDTDFKGLHWFRWQGATGVITVALTELILQLRLYALWSLKTRILVIMLTIFMACLAASATLQGDGMAHISASSSDIPGLPFCNRTNPGRGLNQFWLPILFSESVFCGLAVYRGIRTYYDRTALFHKRQPLLEILIRDSILYFLMVFATYLTNAIIFLKANDTQMECVGCFAIAAASVMGNRLCLNVCDMAPAPPSDDSSVVQSLTIPLFYDDASFAQPDRSLVINHGV